MFSSKTEDKAISLAELKALGPASHGRHVWLENPETEERELHYFDSVTGTPLPLSEFRKVQKERALARWTPARQEEFRQKRMRRKELTNGRERSSFF